MLSANSRIVCLALILVTLVSLGAQAKPSVAVIAFQVNIPGTNSQLQQSCEDLLRAALAQTQAFTVVERSRLEAIMEEQKLSLTGFLDSSELRIQVGKLLGADYLVAGTITSFDVHTETFRGYGVATTKLVATLSGVLQMMDVTTGALEVALPLSGAHEEVYSSNQRLDRKNYLAPLLEKALAKAMPQLVAEFGGSLVGSPSVYEVDYATVYVSSVPEGAQVYVDDRYYGRTPVTIDLPKGTSTFEVSHSMYRPWIRELNVFDGLRVNANLE